MSGTAGIEAIVIGASAGAVDALSTIIPALPAEFPIPIMIVVHVPADRRSVLAEIFQLRSPLRVREAEDKEPILGGHIYFAAPDYHLLVERDRRLSLSSEEPVFFSRPAIDVLFESAADAYRESLAGVILTGASGDGAAGLAAIRRNGGTTFVQDPAGAAATAMPRAALTAVPDALVMNIDEIASALVAIGSSS